MHDALQKGLAGLADHLESRHEPREPITIAYSFCLVDMGFTAAECKRRKSYLAESKDLSELERGIRAVEQHDVTG